MGISSSYAREAEKVRHSVFVSFDVLAGEAMGAGGDQASKPSCDELDCCVVWRVELKFARLEEPSNS
jgi:hypothetical protein